MDEGLVFSLDDRYTDYLADESGLAGSADTISFPDSEDQIVTIVRRMAGQHNPITIQGGGTGILGGSVPSGGHLMSLSRFRKVKDFSDESGYVLTVEPGITLAELEEAVDRLDTGKPLFWPPDPTEKTASAGGVVSCGSAGCTSLLYGPTADYVEALRVVDSGGGVHSLRRGEGRTGFMGGTIDPVDLYLSREGILGVITEITLRLIVKPKETWGVAFFFDTPQDAWRFAEELQRRGFPGEEAGIAAMEYLDRATIDIIERHKENMSAVRDMPDVPGGTAAMVCLEIHGASDPAVEAVVEPVMHAAAECGSDPDEGWAVSGQEIERLRAFRHAAAESVNLKLQEARREHPGITKLGTDMTVPGVSFGRVVGGYEGDLSSAGLKGAIFGHIEENHLHVNILPENPRQYRTGKTLVRKWARECREAGGRITTEHGAGKLKAELFAEFTDREALQELRRLKKDLDPEGLWNPGTLVTGI